ncbi:MAG: glutaredoxin domain-containing protein [Halieaceae bacterium]
MTNDYQVYWAPGCTSCLRTKEFLTQQGIAFESINIVEHPEALDDLARIGYRSVPIVRRGDDAVFCQDLQDVADFVGVALTKSELSAEDFINKIDLILQAASRFVRQLSEDQLADHFPGRDRPYRDLAYHIYMVVQGFLESVQGGSLEMEAFLRTAPEGMTQGDQIAEAGEVVRDAFSAWWDGQKNALPATVNTYYGERTMVSVLERTAWHSAQHCRQLQAVLENYAIEPNQSLGDAELAGLPLPENIYDNEIDMNDEGIETKPMLL